MSGAYGPLSRVRRLLAAETAAIRWWFLVVAAELALVTAYLAVSDVIVTEPRYVVYPFLWINAGVWAVIRTETPSVTRRQWGVAAALSGGYLLLLLVVGGTLQLGIDGPLNGGAVASIHWNIPGLGPIVVYGTPRVRLSIIPFKVVGYVAMTYLVYARLLSASRAVLSGVLGLFSCVGCAFSLLLPLLGATTLFGSTLTGLAWDLSTLVFLLTVALLYWTDDIGAALSRRLPR
ncbi:hypothetical protein EI982_13070 [Haloplanus rallus]|uniref:Uncharacterized protein n=1 Tax=Haloplanus rallus TaxID=1816183 RepID=A0A6B9F5L2_9EURY|nr:MULTISPECIES: hypothetical protein [Haloplanus]QGX95658.1 hypothetical protein EI982_13070 [Haloplanus rallus]